MRQFDIGDRVRLTDDHIIDLRRAKLSSHTDCCGFTVADIVTDKVRLIVADGDPARRKRYIHIENIRHG